MWIIMQSILLIFSFIQLNVLGQPPTLPIGSIQIGKFYLFIKEMVSPLFQSTQCQNGFQHMTHVQHSTYLTNIKAYGISLIGYESVVQNAIYIKSYINKVNTTHVEIGCSCQQETIFTEMRFSYILIKDDIGFIEVYSDCILCGEQDSLTGYRKWQFAVRQHTTPYSNDIQISSSLSAFNVSNVEGSGINFKLSSKMKTTDNFIYYTIQAYSWTKVVSVCITTIVYDFSKTQSIWAPYEILVKTQTKNIDWNDKATKIQPTYPCFQYPNAMFYGISAIDMMFQPKTEQVLLFDLSKPYNLSFNFQSNQNINKVQLSAFYIRWLNCPTGYFFDPQTYDCVFACPAKTGPNAMTKYCQKCHQTCAICQGSGDNKCLTCNNATLNKFRVVYSPPNKCVCDTGYIEALDGSVICLKCSELIENCLECTNSTFCTQCVSTYQFNPLTNKCGCANTSEYLSQGSCLSFAGCLTVLHSTNIQNYCSFCDESKNFQFVIENNTCRCKANYTLSPALIKCVDICGDGIVIDLECDDGNNVNGDGCSSTCQQQPGYFCVGKDIQQPSLCMPMWNFSISYLYAQRDISSNEGTFVFVLSPPEPKISGMNLLECLSFSFPSKIVSYQYDSVSGRLLVKAEFNESIEGVSHDFKLNMRSVKIMTNEIKSEFVVKGMNSWLIRDEYSGIYKFVIYGILVLCLLVWIVAIVVSLLGFKHLAIELVFPIQSIYLVLMEESSNAPGLRALDLMKLINGYNSLNAFKLKQISSLNDTRYYALQYLQNLNFFILINIFFISIVFILKAIHFNKSKKVNKEKLQLHSIYDERKKDLKKCKNKVQMKETNEMYQERIDCQSATIKQFELKLKPFQKVVKYLGSRFCSLIILFIIQASIYYLGTYMILGSYSDKFPPFLNNMGCIVCVGLGLFSLWIYCGFKDNQITLIINEKSKFCYTKLYMISYVVFASLLILLESFGVKGLVLIPIIQVTLILVVLILKNPYNKAESRRPRLILPIIQQIILSVPLYLLWISGFLNTLDPLIYFITTILIISCCFLAILISSIRTFFQWKYFALIERKSNLEAVEQNELDEKQKLTNIKDEKITESKDNDKNNKEYETVVKQKNNADLKDLSDDKINGVETNKRKKNEFSNENGYDSVSSNDDNNEEDLELIKKRLRTELRSKRAVRSK